MQQPEPQPEPGPPSASPRYFEGKRDATVLAFFKAFSVAIGSEKEQVAQCDHIVRRLTQRGVFDLGGLFNLYMHDFVALCNEKPDGGFSAPGKAWAGTLEDLAKFSFRRIECVLLYRPPPPTYLHRPPPPPPF